MEPTTTSQRTRNYPRTPDGKYKYTTEDGQPLHFEPDSVPGLIGDYPQIPASVSKFFRKLFRRNKGTGA